MSISKSNKKALGFLTVAVGVFLLLLAFYTEKKEIQVVEETYEAPYEDILKPSNTSKISKKDVKTKKALKSEETAVRKPASLKSSTAAFNQKSREIIDLAKNFKENKQKLIEVVSSKDVFKSAGKEPDPHSVDDIIQQQEGALRVLALRLLMKNESSTNLKDDLNTIINKAKDPTMTKIAEAALKSVEEGRPFFEDVPNAIYNL